MKLERRLSCCLSPIQLRMLRQGRSWDEKMQSRKVYAPQNWLEENLNLPPEQREGLITAENKAVGQIHSQAMRRACRMAAKNPNFRPFTQSVIEFGSGDALYGEGWENEALRLGLVPRYIEVSPWVLSQIRRKVELKLEGWLKQYPALRRVVQDVDDILIHSNIEYFLDTTLSDETAIASFSRLISHKNREFKTDVQGIGTLLSQKNNPAKNRMFVFIDSLQDHNSEDGKRKRPSSLRYHRNLERGAECLINWFWIVKEHKFFRGQPGEKTFSAWYVQAA